MRSFMYSFLLRPAAFNQNSHSSLMNLHHFGLTRGLLTIVDRVKHRLGSETTVNPDAFPFYWPRQKSNNAQANNIQADPQDWSIATLHDSLTRHERHAVACNISPESSCKPNYILPRIG